MYLYEEHGAEKAIQILSEMNRINPSRSNIIKAINDILEIDIVEEYPIWLDNMGFRNPNL